MRAGKEFRLAQKRLHGQENILKATELGSIPRHHFRLGDLGLHCFIQKIGILYVLNKVDSGMI